MAALLVGGTVLFVCLALLMFLMRAIIVRDTILRINLRNGEMI